MQLSEEIHNDRLELSDGANIAVIGGGPAGSFFSYFALDFAERYGLSVHIDIIEAKDFFRRGSNETEKKRKENPKYDNWFKKTRLNGFLANNKTSNMENLIREELKNRNIKLTKLRSDIQHTSVFSQKYDRSWFHHDFYLKELNTIVEYNGLHWHKDKEFEIEKAFYCSSLHSSKYIILWEKVFKTAKEYVDFILMKISENTVFSSTDKNEELNFLRYEKSIINQHEWDDTFLKVANTLSERSKCQSKKVCALAVKNNRIIATGLNGSITGGLNCCDVFPNGVNEKNRLKHREWSAKHELHAEQSLIAEAARSSVSLEGCSIYVNLQPCEKCTIYLTALGAKRIIYDKDYDFGDANYSLSVFKRTNISFHKHDLDSII